ncbi:MAG: hypothetical protein RL186_883 [Pseudomonadota bacterium]|jgi:lysozyme
MSRLTASRAAFDLITSFEGFRARAALAPSGKWTLGFGHSATAREGLSVTRLEAEDLLRWDLLPVEDMIRQRALMPLSQNQFDALVSFAFNIGLDNFSHSAVLAAINQGKPVDAALAMQDWCHAHVNGRSIIIDALVRRRAAEIALFLDTHGARPAAPTPVVRPQISLGADRPAQSAAPVIPEATDQKVTPIGLQPFPEPEPVDPDNSKAPEASVPITSQFVAPHSPEREAVEVVPPPAHSARPPQLVAADKALSTSALIVLALGAALLVFGAYGAWRIGLTLPLPAGRVLATNEIWALFAAITGFTILVTTLFSVFGGRDNAPAR